MRLWYAYLPALQFMISRVCDVPQIEHAERRFRGATLTLDLETKASG